MAILLLIWSLHSFALQRVNLGSILETFSERCKQLHTSKIGIRTMTIGLMRHELDVSSCVKGIALTAIT